jgi:hypothetical protein
LNAGPASQRRGCGGCIGSCTTGAGIGLDYRFAIADKYSINPYLMTSGKTSSNISGSYGRQICRVPRQHGVSLELASRRALARQRKH